MSDAVLTFKLLLLEEHRPEVDPVLSNSKKTMFAFEFHLVPVFVSSGLIYVQFCPIFDLLSSIGFHLIFVRIYCPDFDLDT